MTRIDTIFARVFLVVVVAALLFVGYQKYTHRPNQPKYIVIDPVNGDPKNVKAVPH